MTYRAKLDRLLDGTLAPEDFGHADHVGVAFEMLRRAEFIEAYDGFSKGVRDLARRAGADGKFSATITFAYLSVIAERMRRKEYADGAAFIADNADLLDGTFLKSRFSPERLSDEEGRASPLLPDLA